MFLLKHTGDIDSKISLAKCKILCEKLFTLFQVQPRHSYLLWQISQFININFLQRDTRGNEPAAPRPPTPIDFSLSTLPSHKNIPYCLHIKTKFNKTIDPLLENKAVSENCPLFLYGCVRNKIKWRRYDSSRRVQKYILINKMWTSPYIDMDVDVIKQTSLTDRQMPIIVWFVIMLLMGTRINAITTNLLLRSVLCNFMFILLSVHVNINFYLHFLFKY